MGGIQCGAQVLYRPPGAGRSDDHVAEDLLQDVFLRIHNRLDSLKDEDRLVSWLYQISRNVVTDYYRRRSTLALDANQPDSDVETRAENLNAEAAAWLSRLVVSLPDDYRQAMTMSELKGIPQTEIAQRIGLSTSGAKSRVQRGRKLLKEMLLRCCHFELDGEGNVVDYEMKAGCSLCCDSANCGA